VSPCFLPIIAAHCHESTPLYRLPIQHASRAGRTNLRFSNFFLSTSDFCLCSCCEDASAWLWRGESRTPPRLAHLKRWNTSGRNLSRSLLNTMRSLIKTDSVEAADPKAKKTQYGTTIRFTQSLFRLASTTMRKNASPPMSLCTHRSDASFGPREGHQEALPYIEGDVSDKDALKREKG